MEAIFGEDLVVSDDRRRLSVPVDAAGAAPLPGVTRLHVFFHRGMPRPMSQAKKWEVWLIDLQQKGGLMFLRNGETLL